MNLKPFFSYYGGKWRSAPHYPRPTYNLIIEPFAGSAGYSMRYPDRDVILFEKNPIVAAVWEYLIIASYDEIMALPTLEEGQSLDDTAFDHIPLGAKALIGFNMQQGAAHPGKRPTHWGRHDDGSPRLLSSHSPNQTWGEARKRRCAEQVQHIRHWKIFKCEYWGAPDVEATWFVDPPYQKAGKYYKCGSAEIDYMALGAWCGTRKGQTIVCENVGADWLGFEPFRKSKALPMTARLANRDTHYSDEAIWVGG